MAFLSPNSLGVGEGWLPKVWQQHQHQRKPVSFRAAPDSGLTPRPPEIYVLSAASTKFMQQNCQLCCFHSCLLVCLSIYACVCVRARVCVCVCLSASWPLSHMSEQAAGSRQVNRSLTLHCCRTSYLCNVARVAKVTRAEASHSCEWHKYASKSLKGAARNTLWKLVKNNTRTARGVSLSSLPA